MRHYDIKSYRGEWRRVGERRAALNVGDMIRVWDNAGAEAELTDLRRALPEGLALEREPRTEELDQDYYIVVHANHNPMSGPYNRYLTKWSR